MPSFDAVLDPNLRRGARTPSTRPARRSARASTSRAPRRGRAEGQGDHPVSATTSSSSGRSRDILLAKLTKRSVDARFLDRSAKIEKIGGDKVKQASRSRAASTPRRQEAADARSSRASSRCRPSIQGDTVRVTGAKRDDLQAAMALHQQGDRRTCRSRSRTSATEPMSAWPPPPSLLLSAAGAGADGLDGRQPRQERALLVIDGKPRTVAVGATVDGVRLVSVSGNDALVEVKGKRVTLQPRRRAGEPRRQGERGRRQADRPHRAQRRPLRRPWHDQWPEPSASSSTPARPWWPMDKYEAERLGLDYKNGRRGISRHRQRHDRRLPRQALVGANRRRPGLRRRCDRARHRRCRSSCSATAS